MSRIGRFGATFLFGATMLLGTSDTPQSAVERIWHHRNLGKAYYENPVTQLQAVEEFKQALELSPKSARDQVNYGLALLRAGITKEAIGELEKAQKTDPSIPHTWFNLGMIYKKEFESGRAIVQLEGMLKLVPDEPVTHYNLGVLYKQAGNAENALSHFLVASRLDPNFAAPHFQLYNAYRESNRKDDSSRELSLFNEIKKRKAGAAVPEDPEWSFYSEIYDTVELDGEYEQANSVPSFKFEPRKIASGVDPKNAGIVVLDFDGDGQPDLLVWSQNGIIILKNGVTTVANTGLEDLKEVTSVEPGDFNNDGLPDLAVITTSGAMLYVNRKSKFESYTAKLPAGSFTRAIWIDYDHDYDLDLILLGNKNVLLRNEGSAGFSDQTSHFPFAPGRALDAAVFDLVPDNNETDLAVQYEDGSLIVYRDKLMGEYEAQLYSSKVPAGVGIHAVDINNDGWTDLVSVTSTGVRILINDHGKLKAGPEVARESGPVVLTDIANRALMDIVVGSSIYRNLGKSRFEQVKSASLNDLVALAEGDFDGDGRVDLAAVTRDGSIEILKNALAAPNGSIRIHLEGVKNLKVPIGAVVEVKAGAWYQKRHYSGVPLLFGLRAYPEVDTVRITWPNGLVQNEVKQPVGKQFAFKEQSRLSGSCPTVFARNGATFTFVTDVLGVAPLGASNGDGRYFPVNHREYIQIPAKMFSSQRDHYEIRITEELREVSYLDKVQLIAVDHPGDIELFTNDKFKNPPFPEFRLFGVKRRVYPVSASDDAGQDVLKRIMSRDSKYVDSFRRTDAGVADFHHLTLDFGKAAQSNRAILVLTGWVDWPDGSTFLSAAQERKEGLLLPYLQVKNRVGQWQTVIRDMGMPSGKPKTVVVDLTGKFLSDSREIRIGTNLCVYWDEVFLSEETELPAATMRPLLTESADLRYRGFSRATIIPGRTQPEQFDYEKWIPVRAKDSDANTAYARSVEPLPFHGMANYPYPNSQHFPDDLVHRNYLMMFNTRRAVPDLAALREAN